MDMGRLRGAGRFIAAVTVLVLGCVPAMAHEFDPFRIQECRTSLEKHFSRRGAPEVSAGLECPKEGDCWPVIRNGKGVVLEAFGSEDTVTELATARYAERAFVLVKHSYECGDDWCTERLLYDDRGEEREMGIGLPEDPLSLHVTPKGRVACLDGSGYRVLSPDGGTVSRLKAPVKLTHGRIQNNLAGDLAIIAVSESDSVWLSNGQSWQDTTLRLAEHGDRRGVLSAHPLPGGETVGAVYRYVNVFNKGIHVVRSDYERDRGTSAPVYLAHERNVGWDPEIFLAKDCYRIAARDSTRGIHVQVDVPRDEMSEVAHPDPDRFLPRENFVTLFAGTGFMLQNWDAKSEVSKNGVTHTKVDYRMDRTLLWSSCFQGRVGDTRLALTYLKEVAGDKAEGAAGETASEAMEYLIGTIDFEGLFSESSSLRLAFRRSRTKGLARIEQDGGEVYEPFTVRYAQTGLYQVKERGFYWGGEYTDYKLPSAVGFSDQSKDIVYSDYDPDMGFSKLSLVFGYDSQAYCKRYETDYLDWYWSGKAGLGLGKAAISGGVKREAKTATGKDEVNLPLFFAFDGMLETGLIWQKRYLAARGFGFQLLTGYRAVGTYLGAGQGEESEGQKDLTLELSRYDIWHGPFVRFNVIF
jgi:hypothetical protein